MSSFFELANMNGLEPRKFQTHIKPKSDPCPVKEEIIQVVIKLQNPRRPWRVEWEEAVKASNGTILSGKGIWHTKPNLWSGLLIWFWEIWLRLETSMKKKEKKKLKTMHIWPESRTFEAKLRQLVNGTVNCSRFPFSSSINYKSGTAAV